MYSVFLYVYGMARYGVLMFPQFFCSKTTFGGLHALCMVFSVDGYGERQNYGTRTINRVYFQRTDGII